MTGAEVSPLTSDLAGAYLSVAVAGARREYPNMPGHLLTGPEDLRPPRQVHPAFYGCLDWHSAVHTHWLMARLCRLLPEAPGNDQARAVLAEHLTATNLGAEAAYLAHPDRAWFERPYGRAWVLALAAELGRWAAGSTDPGVAEWARAVRPLAGTVVEGFLTWLPRLGYPVRAGTHGNTAFALVLALDAVPYLGTVADRPEDVTRLESAARRWAATWFGGDTGGDTRFEPGGADFLSPVLVEAALMARVVPEFPAWLAAFLPALDRGEPANLLVPVDVPDRADPHGVHLDGLNLSRAWCWQTVAARLPGSDPRVAVATAAARRHLDAALPHVCSGDFTGEHWLATFAALALT